MNTYANSLKQTLNALIHNLAETPERYVKNPQKDFTRTRKLSFETVIQLLISMGGNSLYKELLDTLGYQTQTATASAFVQQRDKILTLALETLFHRFTESCTTIRNYRGYRLLAIDGSDLPIAPDPTDADTFFQNRPHEKGFSLLHLNAIYDLESRVYVDAQIQPRRQINEGRALKEMVERSSLRRNVLVLADRGYESYNNLAHLERKGWSYLIRVKDVKSSGILSSSSLPNQDLFDVSVQKILTRKQTREVKENPNIYTFISSTSTFDFLDLDQNLFYPISFRVLRLALPNETYETVLTNLSDSDFSPDEIGHLYKWRWGIETSFRALKHTIGLTHFHAKKRAFIAQEIFARMILYNFAEMVTSHVIISQTNLRHPVQVNFTVAVHVCRSFLRTRNDEPPPDVEALIRKNVLPIRPLRQGKSNVRKVRCQSSVSFVYRVA